MADSVQFVFWQVLIYGLGAAGLFAIGGLPLRTFMLARGLRANSKYKWQAPSVVLAAVIAIIAASQFLFQLARCLLGFHCSANAAGGWINAAFIGAIYVIFELLALAIRLAGARNRVAT